MAAAEAEGADLLTGFVYQEVVSFAVFDFRLLMVFDNLIG